MSRFVYTPAAAYGGPRVFMSPDNETLYLGLFPFVLDDGRIRGYKPAVVNAAGEPLWDESNEFFAHEWEDGGPAPLLTRAALEKVNVWLEKTYSGVDLTPFLRMIRDIADGFRSAPLEGGYFVLPEA